MNNNSQLLIDDFLKKIFPDPHVIFDILFRKYGSDLRKEYQILTDLDNSVRIFSNEKAELQSILGNLLQNPTLKNAGELFVYMSFLIFLKESRYGQSRIRDNIKYNEEYRFFDTTWVSIQKTFAEMGYEFHYFNFFNMNEPKVKVFWDRVKLNKKLQNISENQDTQDLQYKLDELQKQLQNVVEVSPQNFEAATILLDQNIYNEGLKTFETSDSLSDYSSSSSVLSNIDTNNGFALTGWKKVDLRNAIRKTGLNIPVKTGKFKTYQGKQYEIMKSPLAEMFGYKRSKLPGIDAPPISQNAINIGFTQKHQMEYQYEKTPNHNKLYYEIIYRKLFNTLANVDWSVVCKGKLLGILELQQIAINEFDLNPLKLKDSNYEEICSALTIESDLRRSLRKMSKLELKENIPLLQPAILYQPGSQLVSQLTQGTQSMMIPTLGPQKEINTAYGELYNMCSNPNTTREDIFNIAGIMGLFEIVKGQYTKEGVCKALKNYIETTQIRNLFK